MNYIVKLKMTNLTRTNFKVYSSHLDSPSPWPVFTCFTLFLLSDHGYAFTQYEICRALYNPTPTILQLIYFWLGNETLEETYFNSALSPVSAISLQLGVNWSTYPLEIDAVYPFKLTTFDMSIWVASPIDQFDIRNLLSLDVPILANLHLSITNIGLYLTIAALITLCMNILATNYNKIIADRWSVSQESVYATVHSIVINQINGIKGQAYFPFIFALFILILVNNLIGMVPYSFASTSHFILTFSISFTVVLGATILGFQKHGLKFFSLFVPAGCPLGLLPLLVLIEFISYLARNISLGLRLAANILSGHMLLNILSGFAYNIMTSSFVFFFVGLIPLAFIIAFSGLELGIAFIQAQVFVVLTCSYIKDGLDLH